MPVITVVGLASGRRTILEVSEEDKEEILLYWLRRCGITIASSCDGEGVCKKCGIQNGWLTCMFTVGGFLEQNPPGVIEVSYL